MKVISNPDNLTSMSNIIGVLYINNKPHLRAFDLIPPENSVFVDGQAYLEVGLVKGVPDRLQFENMVPFIDIDTYSEFQKLCTPQGWYWCEFYGGEKQYRCFLLPSNLRRADFFKLDVYNSLLDESIEPIYSHNNIVVRQDPTHAMPGFYIVAPNQGYASTDQLDLALYMNMRLIDYRIGSMLKDIFGIKKIYRVNEERKVAYQNVHTWLLPIDTLENKSIEEWNTLDYMVRFSSWRDYKSIIIEYNQRMRHLSQETSLAERSDLWNKCFMNWDISVSQKINNCPRAADTSSLFLGNDIVYANEGIQIRYVSQTNIIGHYVIEFLNNKNANHFLRNEENYLRVRFLDYQARIALREVLNIEYVYKLCEKKGDLEGCPPVFLLPIFDINKYNRIYHFTIADYKKTFSDQKIDAHRIKEMNEKVRAYFYDINLHPMDNVLIASIREFHNLEKVVFNG